MEKFLYFIAIHLENSIFGQFCRLYYPQKRVSEWDQNALVIVESSLSTTSFVKLLFDSTLKGLRRLNFLLLLMLRIQFCPFFFSKQFRRHKEKEKVKIKIRFKLQKGLLSKTHCVLHFCCFYQQMTTTRTKNKK